MACDRCLAFCQPTNPLTRPEHALLTPRSQTLLTSQLKGLERGWDAGADEAPEALPVAWDLCADPHSGAGRAAGRTCSATSCRVTWSKLPSSQQHGSTDPYLIGFSGEPPEY